MSLRLRYLIIPIIIFGSCIAQAGQDWTAVPIGPFAGLNNRDSSFAIPAPNAQDLLNVELTPGGKSVRKRHGYGVAFTLNQTTSPVHGVYDFFDSNGNEVNLFFSDTNVYGSVGGAAATVLLSTAPNGATWQCTDSLGIAYCVNSSRTGLYKISGSTLNQIMSVVSTGTMIATAVDRLVMAGFSDAPSRIDFSAAGDFTTWGTGSLGSSAVQQTINAPGAKITHLDYTFGRVMWFKDTSFGYALIGNQPLQTDWIYKTVAFDVGTNDNSYVYREGILYFRGKDGHIYMFDGYTYQRLSREIAGTVNQAQSKTSNKWVQTSQTDFAAGSSTNSVYTDSSTAPGILQLNFPDYFSTYRDGTNGTQTVWTKYNNTVSSGSVQISSGSLNLAISNNGSGGLQNSISARTGFLDSLKMGTTYHVTITSITESSTRSSNFYLVLTTFSVLNSTAAPHTTNNQFTVSLFRTGTIDIGGSANPVLLSNGPNDGNLCTVAGSKDFGFPATVDFYLATSTYRLNVTGPKDSFTCSGSHTWSGGANGQVYLYLEFAENQGGTQNIYLNNFGISPTTMSWSSSVNNSANLVTWDAFSANTINNGGNHTWYIRGTTFSFTASSTYPWTSITSGNIPTISTASFFQIRDDLSISTWTNNPQLLDFTQNWFEGSASDKSYATYFDDKIIFSAPIGTGTTTNNRDLIYDLLDHTWLLWDLPSNGFYVKANKLYFGSSNGGYIYKYGDIEDDNGAAINSYWKSKDFFGGDPFTTQELANISLVGKEVANSSATVTYTLEGSSTTSFIFPLTGVENFVGLNKNLPAGSVGSNFVVQVGNNAAGQPWEIFGIQVGIRPRSWVPGKP